MAVWELFNICPRVVLSIGLLVSWVSGFNLDTRAPIVKRGDPGSLFGFSVALHRVDADNSSTTRFLVGAPQATYFDEPFLRTGMVYSCPVSTFRDDCKPIDVDYAIPQAFESLAGRWLGVTLQSAGPGKHVLICAPRFTHWEGNDPAIKSFRRSGPARLVGRCYHLRADLSLVDSGDAGPGMWEPCNMFPGLPGGSFHCLAGAGASIYQHSNGSRVDLAMGNPDVYYSQGGMVFVRHKGDPDSLDSLKLENAPSIYSTEETDRNGDDGYLGFSVTVMDTTKGVKFVAGAPRAAGGKGAVVVYSWNDELSLWETETTLEGQQLAAGFGYALCTADVTGDSIPDLVVAAPFYFNAEGDEGGAVYVYKTSMAGDKLFEGEPLAVKYGSRHSHFGLAVTNAGDLNKDGFEDIAVGAPYEGEGGAVHIIHGSPDGLSTENTQRIEASSLPGDLGLSTFGYSLSGGLDVDGNNYPDLLVGAFNSSTTVSLRSRPIIHVNPGLRLNPPMLDMKEVRPSCVMRNRQVPCFEIDMLFERRATGDEAVDNTRFRVDVRLELDKTYRERTGQTRVFFNGARKHVLQRSLRLATASGNKRIKAVRVKAYLKEDVADFSPVRVTMNYNLTPPVLANTSSGKIPAFDWYPILHPSSNTSLEMDLRIAEDKSDGFYIRGTSIPSSLYISHDEERAGPDDFQFLYQVVNQGPMVRESSTLYLFLPVGISNGQLFTWASVTKKGGDAEVSCKQVTDEPILASEWSGKASIIRATQTNWKMVEEECIAGAASWHIINCTIGRLGAGDNVVISVEGKAISNVALKEMHQGNKLTFDTCAQIESDTKSPVAKASIFLLIEATVKALRSLREKRQVPSVWSQMPGENLEEFGSRICQQLGSDSCSECLHTAFWCGWCSDQEYSESRCDMVHRLADEGCPSANIMNPRSEMLILRDEPKPQDESFLFFHPQEAVLRMRPGRSMRLGFQMLTPPPPFVKAIDLYILMDMSNSMADDLFILWDSLDALVQTVLQADRHVRLGFGTFVDKTVLPFTDTFKLDEPCTGCAPAFSFRNVQGLTDDFRQFNQLVTEQKISGNLDSAEGLLDALMQVTVCEEEIGWRRDAAHVILVLTDAPFHWAGDGKLGGIVLPNDGLCHLDEKGEDAMSTKQDYPTVALLRDKMWNNRVTTFFAVSPQIMELYEELTTLLSPRPSNTSSVYKLQSESKNIVDIVQDVINRNLTAMLPTEYRTDVFVQGMVNSTWVSLHKVSPGGDVAGAQEAVQYTANVTFLSCNGKADPVQFDITAVGTPHSLRVTVEPICQCPCDDIPPVPSHPSCSGHGSLSGCGGCSCDEGRYGARCECDATAVADPMVCRRREDEALCSGRGDCICGECVCKPMENPSWIISGQFCECDNFTCDYYEQQPCGGPDRGRCECGQCVCHEGWTGTACQCPTSVDTCRASNGLICNGRGRCECGACTCDDSYYRGPHCEDCPTCPGMCERLKDCGDCIARESSDCMSIMCSDIKITTANEVRDGFSDGIEWRLCRFNYFGKDRLQRPFVFAYGYEGNKVVLQYKTRGTPQIPGPPGSLQVRASAVANTIMLAWTAPSVPDTEVDGYQIGYGQGTPDREMIRVSGDTRTYTLQDLEPDTEYIISLRAFNRLGQGRPIYEVTRTLPTATPDSEAPLMPPIGVKTQVLGPNTILVSWTDSSLAKNQLPENNRYYTVRWMAVGSPDRKTHYVNTNSLEYSVTNLRPNTKYEFSVKIMIGRKQSQYSLTVVNSTAPQGGLPGPASPEQVPAAPSALRLQPESDSITVAWTPPLDVDTQLQGYVIGYGQGTPDLEKVQVGADVRTYILRNLAPDSEYIVSLRAFNSIGEGRTIYEVTRTLSTAPEEKVPLMTPAGVKARVLGPNSILVSWMDPSVREGQTGRGRYYTIRWMSFGAPDRKTFYINTTSMQHSVSNLTPYTQYEFSVKTVDGRRESQYSLAVVNRTAQTMPGTPPQNVAVRAFEKNPTQVVLEWMPPTEPNGMITGYLIFYTTDPRKAQSDWAVDEVSNVNSLTYKVTDLAPGARYYFSVQARNSVGFSPMSSPVEFRTLHDEKSAEEAACRQTETSPVCSGHGDCVSGFCQCYPHPDHSDSRYYGKYCECNNVGCPYSRGLRCAGHGYCDCQPEQGGNSTCVCEAGWTGPDCDCSTDPQPCQTSNGVLCNDHGVCSCGLCQCEVPYSGPTCEDCPTCQGSCTQLRDCAECVANNRVDCDISCSKTTVSYMDELPQGPLPVGKWKLCEFVDPERNLPFVFSYDPDSDNIVLHVRLVMPSSTTTVPSTISPEANKWTTTELGLVRTLIATTETPPQTTARQSRISRLLPCCVLSADERCQDKCGRVLLTATNNQQILRNLISACGIPSVTDPLWSCFLQASSPTNEQLGPPPTPQPLPETLTAAEKKTPVSTTTAREEDADTTVVPTTTVLPLTTTTTTTTTTIQTTVPTTTEVTIPQTNCEEEICPVTWCSYPYQPPGTCCPICEDCSYEDRFVNNGDIFVLDDDVCTICLCALGWVDCSPAFCQQLSCNKTIVPPGKCCPVCEDDYILLGGLPDYSPTSEIDIYGEEFDNCRPIYGPICSDHGTCVNGACECESDPEDPEKLYYGPHCECNNFDCDSHNGQICGGNGQCECSSCLCDVGWAGSACNCSVAVEPCTAQSGQLCNRRGVCECGECQCEDGYSGPTCEECTNCPDQCEDFETCVDCMYWELTSGCNEDCNNFENPVIMLDNLNITEELEAGRTQCQYIAEDLLDECYANYTYGYNEEGIIDIHIPSTVTCDYPDYSNYDWTFDEEDLPEFEYN